MCGRLAQIRAEEKYMRWLDKKAKRIIGESPIDRYNVAPGTDVKIIIADGDAATILPLHWGYKPHWASGSPVINARIEKASTSPYWRAIRGSRCIVPADGWFEWIPDESDPKRKQPYYITTKDGAPLLLAGLGRWHTDDASTHEGDGFVLITADSEGGMVDIHDRRPVALPPDVAREWLDPDTTKEHAEDLARQHHLPTDAFHWYPVSKAVGSVRNQGRQLIEPI